MSSEDAKIGIVAGAGPYAGLDLAQKILQQTSAIIDQDYLPTISISTPADIADRTRFLLGQTTKNPAHAIFRNLTELEDLIESKGLSFGMDVSKYKLDRD